MTPEKTIDFPPLPIPGSVSISNSDLGSVELRDNFTAQQMRDYVAADRAQRQAEPTTPPYSDDYCKGFNESQKRFAAIIAQHKAQRQAGQEPVAYMYHDASSAAAAHPLLHSTLLVFAADRKPHYKNETPLYTAAPQPAAQPAVEPLTNRNLFDLLKVIHPSTVRMPADFRQFARAVEAAHGITATQGATQ